MFGLLRKSKRVAESPVAGARPSLLDPAFLRRLESLSLVSRRSNDGRGRGDRRGKKRGSGVEFCDHRPYVPGDDIKSLDWMSLLRHDRLVLRLYEEEEDQSTLLVLDGSASMGLPTEKWLRARQWCAALAFLALTSLDRVSIVVVRDQGLETLGPLRGRTKILQILRFLEDLEASGTTGLARLAELLGSRGLRPTTTVVVSDFLAPEGEGALDGLHYRGYAPRLLEVDDDFLEGANLLGELEVLDVETAERVRVHLGEREREELLVRKRERREALVRLCRRRGWAHVAHPVGEALDERALGALRRGGLVR